MFRNFKRKNLNRDELNLLPPSSEVMKMVEAEREGNKLLEISRRKADEIIASALKEAKRLREEIINKAQVEADNILNNAKGESERIIYQANHVLQGRTSQNPSCFW